jgi:hypothetical protein
MDIKSCLDIYLIKIKEEKTMKRYIDLFCLHLAAYFIPIIKSATNYL